MQCSSMTNGGNVRSWHTTSESRYSWAAAACFAVGAVLVTAFGALTAASAFGAPPVAHSEQGDFAIITDGYRLLGFESEDDAADWLIANPEAPVLWAGPI